MFHDFVRTSADFLARLILKELIKDNEISYQIVARETDILYLWIPSVEIVHDHRCNESFPCKNINVVS
jgi:hypothetical protein